MRGTQHYRYVDAIDLPQLDVEGWNLAGPACVYLEPPGRLRDFRRRPPVFHDDPDGVGLFDAFQEDRITYPPAFIAVAKETRLVGCRTLLCDDGRMFNDDAMVDDALRDCFLSDLASDDYRNESTGLRAARGKNRFALQVKGRSVHQVRGTTILLGSAEPSNYGSFLFRVLPKLQTIAAARDRSQIGAPQYLVWAGHDVFREFLMMAGVPNEQIIDHDPESIYELDTVFVPSMRNNQAFIDPASRVMFSQMREQTSVLRQPGRRIYVSRLRQTRAGSSRVMVNEQELVDRLIGLGFVILEPETLSASEQIRAFAAADLVVGPSGSGMFNVVFCHPGTKVIDLESEPHWIHAHLSLFASCDLEYGIFVGSRIDRGLQEHHQPWSVNIEALVSRILSFY